MRMRAEQAHQTPNKTSRPPLAITDRHKLPRYLIRQFAESTLPRAAPTATISTICASNITPTRSHRNHKTPRTSILPPRSSFRPPPSSTHAPSLDRHGLARTPSTHPPQPLPLHYHPIHRNLLSRPNPQQIPHLDLHTRANIALTSHPRQPRRLPEPAPTKPSTHMLV